MLCGCVRLHDHNSPKPPSGARAGRWRSGRLQRCRFLAIALAKEEARTHLPRGDSVEHERVEVQAICRTGDTSCDDDAAPTPVVRTDPPALVHGGVAPVPSPTVPAPAQKLVARGSFGGGPWAVSNFWKYFWRVN